MRKERPPFANWMTFEDPDDYVDFLRTNSRYDSVLRHQGNDQSYIKDLHKAGYATDPNYADKVLNILQRDSIQEHAKAYEASSISSTSSISKKVS